MGRTGGVGGDKRPGSLLLSCTRISRGLLFTEFALPLLGLPCAPLAAIVS